MAALGSETENSQPLVLRSERKTAIGAQIVGEKPLQARVECLSGFQIFDHDGPVVSPQSCGHGLLHREFFADDRPFSFGPHVKRYCFAGWSVQSKMKEVEGRYGPKAGNQIAK